MPTTWKLISTDSLSKIKSFVEAHGLLDEFKSLGIMVRDYAGDVEDVPETTERLPCNCWARRHVPLADGSRVHSSECAGWCSQDAEGIAEWERFTGRTYVPPRYVAAQAHTLLAAGSSPEEAVERANADSALGVVTVYEASDKLLAAMDREQSWYVQWKVEGRLAMTVEE